VKRKLDLGEEKELLAREILQECVIQSAEPRREMEFTSLELWINFKRGCIYPCRSCFLKLFSSIGYVSMQATKEGIEPLILS
jgi:hypothetical protein